jgi:glycosyltransferase involved in cell wall biosynthesis
MAHYRDHPVDLFISTTASEGGRPVSMAEALSCGVPVVATDVGGVPEIVAEDHGWLVQSHPTAEDVAACVGRVVDRSDLAAFRDAARRYWEQHLRAEDLSEDFARSLRALV